MLKMAIMALTATALVAGCTPIRTYHGYNPDELQPSEIKPGDDTRSTVLARLGTPSTKSIFDDDTWFYMSATQENYAFFKPKVSEREVVAIRFGDDDAVDEVVQYDANDGVVIQYAARETPTRGRELSLIEQLLGSAGTVRLPGQEDQIPGQIPGQR